MAMITSYESENHTKKTFSELLTFKVRDVLQKPDNISFSDTFTIDPYLSSCKCLDILNDGFYLITGKLNSNQEIEVAGTKEVKLAEQAIPIKPDIDDDVHLMEDDDIELGGEPTGKEDRKSKYEENVDTADDTEEVDEYEYSPVEVDDEMEEEDG